MFDSDEITKIVILVTNGTEIFGYRGKLVESNLIEITSGPTKCVPDDKLVIKQILRHV